MSKIPEEVEVLIEDLDEEDITSLLTKWNEVVIIRKQLSDLEEMLKLKVKTYLKERNWERYIDKSTKISVSISTQKRTIISQTELKSILSEDQLAKVTKITTFEKLSIVTPETRERLKSYVKPNKKIS